MGEKTAVKNVVTMTEEFQYFMALFPDFRKDVAYYRRDPRWEHGIIITFTDESELAFYYTYDRNSGRIDWHLTTEIEQKRSA